MSHPILVRRSHHVEEKIDRTSVHDGKAVQHDDLSIFTVSLPKQVLFKDFLLLCGRESVVVVLQARPSSGVRKPATKPMTGLTFARIRLPSLSKIAIPFTRYKLGSCW